MAILSNRYGMISALPKLKEALNQRAAKADNTVGAGAPVSRSAKVKESSRVDGEKLSVGDGKTIDEANIKFEGNPEDQVIVFDIDETIVCGDIYKKNLNDPKVRKQVEADGYEVKQTKQGKYYVLRPGTRELFEYLHSRGHKIVLVSRDLNPYVKDLFESEPLFQKVVSGFLAHDDLISKLNQNYDKYPNHPDNLGFWARTKNFFHGLFVRCPRYCWKKFCSIFTKKPVWLEEGRGVAGKYPINISDLLVNEGNASLKGCAPSHILVDNYAEVKLVGDRDPNKPENYKYFGREYKDSLASGDFAVISPNTPREKGKQPEAFLAQGEELKDSEGRYIWVKNVIEGIEKGWRQQFRDTTGKEPRA